MTRSLLSIVAKYKLYYIAFSKFDYTMSYFVGKSSLKLVRYVVNRTLLDAYESMKMRKGDNLEFDDRDAIPFDSLYSLLK